MILKEIPVGSVEEAIKAAHLGADRIELCENLEVGGTTPSFGTIEICRKKIELPIMVMIRPRGGNFVYSDTELEVMREDIKTCKNIGVDGVVFGVLDEEGNVNYEVMESLTRLASPLEVTMHKAIDECNDPFGSIHRLHQLGVDNILTSGQAETALEGKDNLLRIMEIAREKVEIIIAGKVSSENLPLVSKLLPAKVFHGRAIVGSLSQHPYKPIEP